MVVGFVQVGTSIPAQALNKFPRKGNIIMNTKHVISIGSVDFIHEKWTYDEEVGTYAHVSMEYVEHSTDSYSSNTTTEVDISKEDAIRLVEFLKTAYGI